MQKVKSLTPAWINRWMEYSTMGLPPTSSKGLGQFAVKGPNLSPRPPAMMIASNGSVGISDLDIVFLGLDLYFFKSISYFQE